MAQKKDGVIDCLLVPKKLPKTKDCFSAIPEVETKRLPRSFSLSIRPCCTLLGERENPAAVWKKLEQQFQKKSWVNRLDLRRRLHSLKLKDGESVQDHVKTMVETFNELSIVEDAITAEDRVVYLLASLPDSISTLAVHCSGGKSHGS